MAKTAHFWILTLFWVSAYPAFASIPKLSQNPLAEIKRSKSSDFSELLKTWKKSPSPKRVTELASLAGNPSLEERSRYIALMGVARTASSPSELSILEKLLLRLHQDSSWVLRSATLQVAQEFSHRGNLNQIPFTLLRDKALVIRSQAVDAVSRIPSLAAVEALIQAAVAPENFHGGKALWVPQKALKALSHIDGRRPSLVENPGIAWKLTPLLSQKQDPELTTLTLHALEKLLPKEAEKLSKKLGKPTAEAWLEASRKTL